MAPDERTDYCSRTGLRPQTPHSLVTPQALAAELARVVAEGVAFDREEQELGVHCIAAPIRDENGCLVAGVSLSTPSERFDPRYAERVKATAQAISAALGYRGTSSPAKN